MDGSCPSSLWTLISTTTEIKPSDKVISDFFAQDEVSEPDIFLVHVQSYLAHASDC